MKKLLDSCNFLILGSSCSLPNSYHRQLSFLSSIRSNLNAKYYDYSVYMRCWQPFKEFLETFVSCREFASSPRTKFLKKYSRPDKSLHKCHAGLVKNHKLSGMTKM